MRAVCVCIALAVCFTLAGIPALGQRERARTDNLRIRPTVGAATGSSVPMSTLEKIADAHAFELWGQEVGRGLPIPLVDAGGETFAYLFPFIRGSRQFPGLDNVTRQVRDLRDKFRVPGGKGDAMSSDYCREASRLGNRYGAICVSARNTEFPVLWMAHFLPSHLFTADSARQEAVRRLGRGDAAPGRLYYLNPEEQYMEFTGGGKAVLVDMVLPSRKVPADALTRSKPVPSTPERMLKIQDEWKRVTSQTGVIQQERLFTPDEITPGMLVPVNPVSSLQPGVNVAPIALPPNDISRTHTVKKIAYWELIPIVQHTPSHWCVIASKGMVLGFWDNYVKGKGTISGFGRWIDYWYEYQPGGYNQPNLVDEVLPGKDAAAINKYGWNWTETKSNQTNDYCWSELVAEVDAGRPCFFSIGGHTTAAFGYRVTAAGEKFAIVYDPPNPNCPTYVNEYKQTSCIGVGAVTPTGSTGGEHGIIIAPEGGETVLTSTPNEISWFVWGARISKTKLSFSGDGGKTWLPIANNVPTKGAWNTLAWFPGNACAKARMRIECFTAGNELIAGDGSRNNFAVKPSVVGSKGWAKMWGPTTEVFANYDAQKSQQSVYARIKATGDLYRYNGSPNGFTKIGGPGKSVAMDDYSQLYATSDTGGAVFRYDGTPMKWTQIGGAATALYAGGGSLFAVMPPAGDIFIYKGQPNSWMKIGGSGKMFAVGRKGQLYGLSPDGKGIFRYDGTPMKWTKIGGPASAIYAGGNGLWMTHQQTGEVYCYNYTPNSWTKIGGPGKMFAADDQGRLYALSPDGKGVLRYDGSLNVAWKWTPVGGAAGSIFAGGYGRLFATSPNTNDLYSLE